MRSSKEKRFNRAKGTKTREEKRRQMRLRTKHCICVNVIQNNRCKEVETNRNADHFHVVFLQVVRTTENYTLQEHGNIYSIEVYNKKAMTSQDNQTI
jgi:hypothetical protein